MIKNLSINKKLNGIPIYNNIKIEIALIIISSMDKHISRKIIYNTF